jgi:glycerol-3-phosphate dehydrogenase (NAD(P)+)
MPFDLALFGAGAWGTALAVHLAPRMRVALWARDSAHAALLASARRNARYLPGIALPEALTVTSDLAAAADAATLIVATPASGADRRRGSPRRGRRERAARVAVEGLHRCPDATGGRRARASAAGTAMARAGGRRLGAEFR